MLDLHGTNLAPLKQMNRKAWLLGKIREALYVSLVTGVIWLWQYSKFSDGHGFYYFGRYGFLLMVICHAAIFLCGLRIMWGKDDPGRGERDPSND